MTLYRKKPVIVEARQAIGTAAEIHSNIYKWIERNTLGSFEPLDVIEGREPFPASGVSIDPRDGRIIISTLEGLHWVEPGDFIIRGVQGEFYPCKPDIFEATYEILPGDYVALSLPAGVVMRPGPEGGVLIEGIEGLADAVVELHHVELEHGVGGHFRIRVSAGVAAPAIFEIPTIEEVEDFLSDRTDRIGLAELVKLMQKGHHG